MNTPANSNALVTLADACYNGACNPHGIINALPGAMKCLPFGMARNSPELKIIVGQLSYLLGESLGPTAQAITDYLVARELRIAQPAVSANLNQPLL